PSDFAGTVNLLRHNGQVLEETIQPYTLRECLYVPYSTHLRAVAYRQISTYAVISRVRLPIPEQRKQLASAS
ncbi:MAG: hypothetical protein WAM47_18405, partial [Candidatus Sulfotelmatobacter sp.]